MRLLSAMPTEEKHVYSALRTSLLLILHFKWMKDYGVDGVFVQRFVDYTRGDQKNSVPNRILENALEAASKYDRAIAVMYDLSGLRRSGEDCSMIIEDWKRLVDNQKVTNQSGTKTYLHHNGKPVVAIWGCWFPRPSLQYQEYRHGAFD